MFETVMTGMVDELAEYNPVFRKLKTWITLGMSALLFLLGLPLVTNVSIIIYPQKIIRKRRNLKLHLVIFIVAGHYLFGQKYIQIKLQSQLQSGA